MGMLVLLENNRLELISTEADLGREGVRFRDFVDGFKVAAALHHAEDLPLAPGPHGLDAGRQRRSARAVLECKPEARRHPVLEHLEHEHALASADAMGRVRMLSAAPVPMMMIVPAAPEQEHADDIDGQ